MRSVNDISSVSVSSLYALHSFYPILFLISNQNNVHYTDFGLHSMQFTQNLFLYVESLWISLSVCLSERNGQFGRSLPLSPSLLLFVPVTQFVLFVYIPTFVREVVSHLVSAPIPPSPLPLLNLLRCLHEKLIQLSFHSLHSYVCTYIHMHLY